MFLLGEDLAISPVCKVVVAVSIPSMRRANCEWAWNDPRIPINGFSVQPQSRRAKLNAWYNGVLWARFALVVGTIGLL